MDPHALLDDWLTSGTLRPSTISRYRPEVVSWLTWCHDNGVHPYRADIRHVAKWCEDRYLSKHLDGRRFDRPEALAYLAETSPDVARTHDGRLTAITQYYKAAHERHLVTGVPNLLDLRSGLDRVPDQPQRLTAVERAAFFMCIGMWGPSHRHYLRDRLIAYLLLEGLRPGEVVRLDMRHLYPLPDGTYEVRAPDDFENVGQKHTLNVLTAGALRAYLPARIPPLDGVHTVIVRQGGKPATRRYVNVLVQDMVAVEPTLAHRHPRVTADVVAHTGFTDAPPAPERPGN